MGRYFLTLAIFMLCSCTQSYISHANFSEISLGANITEVEAKIGKAYRTRPVPTGIEHLYIERISLGKDHNVQKHYTLTYSNGFLINKSAKEIEEPTLKANFH